MAYRFTGSGSSNVRFGIGPFGSYTFGAFTMAALYKAASHTDQHDLIFVSTSALNAERIAVANGTGGGGTSKMEWANGASSTTGPSAAGTTSWYLIVATCPGAGSTIRFHVFDGTSWTHVNQSGGSTFSSTALAGTDKIFVSAPSGWGGNYINGDVVCVGIKKADSSDSAVITLNETAFSSWASFGFDWLIGFENSSTLVNRASPGSGDEDARAGVSVVSDPAGWSWTVSSTYNGSSTVSLTDTITTAGTRLGVTVHGASTVAMTATVTTASRSVTLHATTTVTETVTVTTRAALERMILVPYSPGSLVLVPVGQPLTTLTLTPY